ncbi:hypothetical protein [Teredinibacter sp. KSP-S5-2]|uniref:hypothetical protein n=1 Tax=Teredinibacter sp. KSP-S5-2 TaxID=3034506 RepID=UPI0029345657|nr:hypothetical protein [Teredinibacter sp. KSP-S5-2]WNO09281.1 hypothetical protein P5V12_20265 [Teredinibacter sp. KSP-S5-2]
MNKLLIVLIFLLPVSVLAEENGCELFISGEPFEFRFEGQDYSLQGASEAGKNIQWDTKIPPPLPIDKAKKLAIKYLAENPVSKLETILYSVQIDSIQCHASVLPVYFMRFVTVKNKLPQEDYFLAVAFDQSIFSAVKKTK